MLPSGPIGPVMHQLGLTRLAKKLSMKADLAIYGQAVDVRGRCMSESLRLGHNLDFSSCDIMVGFHKSSHIFLFSIVTSVHVATLLYLIHFGKIKI